MEAPPLSLWEGDLIHDGVDPLLDGLGDGTDLVLTGPNASGKSCHLRQIGLI